MSAATNSWVHTAVVSLLLFPTLGCEVTASVGRDRPESAASGGGSVLSSGSASDGSMTASEADTLGGAEGGGSGGGDSGGSTDDGLGEGPGHRVPPLCEVHDGTAACAQCRKNHCCDRILACHDAPGCFCYWDCIVHDKHSDVGCREVCEYEGKHWQELVSCQGAMCPEVCGDGGPTDLPPDSVPPPSSDD